MQKLETLTTKFETMLLASAKEHGIDFKMLWPEKSPSTSMGGYNHLLYDSSALPIVLDSEQLEILEEINTKIENLLHRFLGVVYCGGGQWVCAYNRDLEYDYIQDVEEIIADFKNATNDLF